MWQWLVNFACHLFSKDINNNLWLFIINQFYNNTKNMTTINTKNNERTRRRFNSKYEESFKSWIQNKVQKLLHTRNKRITKQTSKKPQNRRRTNTT